MRVANPPQQPPPPAAIQQPSPLPAPQPATQVAKAAEQAPSIQLGSISASQPGPPKRVAMFDLGPFGQWQANYHEISLSPYGLLFIRDGRYQTDSVFIPQDSPTLDEIVVVVPHLRTEPFRLISKPLTSVVGDLELFFLLDSSQLASTESTAEVDRLRQETGAAPPPEFTSILDEEHYSGEAGDHQDGNDAGGRFNRNLFGDLSSPDLGRPH